MAVSPKACSLPGARVWFHQKLTRHPELCPVQLRCSIPSLQPNSSSHRIYLRTVSTFRSVLQTELLQTRTNPDGASYKTFNHILGVIINYHYGWCCFRLIEEAFRRFFRFLKTPKRQKVTMSPFFWYLSWGWWVILLIINLFIWFFPLMSTLFLSSSVQLLRIPFLW